MLVPSSSILFLRGPAFLFLCIFHVTAHSGDTFMYLWLVFTYIMLRKELVVPWWEEGKVFPATFNFSYLWNWGLLPGTKSP